MASVSVISTTKNSVTVRVSGIGSNVDTINFYYALASESTNHYDTSLGSSNFVSGTCTYSYTGLTPSTTYRFVVATYEGDTRLERLEISKTTLENTWEWSSNVSVGATIPMLTIGEEKFPTPLKASEWLGFVEFIKEKADLVGVILNSTYLSNATTNVAKGKPMTAAQAMGAWNLINQLSPGTPLPVGIKPGADITASFVNGLKNSANSVKA
jgi:hypothetical protein